VIGWLSKVAFKFYLRRYSLRGMSLFADVFDQPLTEWDTARVTDMRGMFFGALAFKGVGLAGWNTESVVDMVRWRNTLKCMKAMLKRESSSFARITLQRDELLTCFSCTIKLRRYSVTDMFFRNLKRLVLTLEVQMLV